MNMAYSEVAASGGGYGERETHEGLKDNGALATLEAGDSRLVLTLQPTRHTYVMQKGGDKSRTKLLQTTFNISK
jgi:hypothetical protein